MKRIGCFETKKLFIIYGTVSFKLSHAANEVDYLVPPISISRNVCEKTTKLPSIVPAVLYPVCSHQDGMRGFLLTYTEAVTQNFLVQCIIYIRNNIPQKQKSSQPSNEVFIL